MVVVNVKNTIVERVLEIVAPHPCLSCGKVGKILCPSCEYDINHEPFLGCILCGAPEPSGVCLKHGVPFQFALVVGPREDSLKEVINALKFQRTKTAAKTLAQLLHNRLPTLPSGVVFVPVPTAAKHVRQRGYDQVKLVTRHIAAMRGVSVEDILVRTKHVTQHTVGREDRAKQAQGLYVLKKNARIDPAKLYLLVDDIVTTGATVTNASRCIAEAGGRVWVVALAYQQDATAG